MPRRTIWSVLAAALLCLVMLPVTALAAAPNGQVIYVGNVNVTSGGYWTTDDSGNVTVHSGEGAPADNFIHYDATNNVLTLYNATIKKGLDNSESIQGGTYIPGSAIGVFHQNGAAELTIQLEGTNTITEVSAGIFVLASSESTVSSSLTITGDGCLDASGSQIGIRVQSNGGNAALSIENAKVTATASMPGDGVLVQSKNASSVSLTVDGGSLTATGSGNNGAGIRLLFGAVDSGSGTPKVTISDNAVVRAGGDAGGIASNASTATPSGAGIVFDGGTGTVYGDVTLQDDLEIGEVESLTIPDGSSLTIPDDKTLTVNGGALTGDVTGTVIYKVTGVSLNKDSLSLEPGGSEALTATVTPDNATNKNVTWSSSAEGVATVDADGKVTAVDAGTAVITVTTEDGNKTATCTVTVEHDPAGAWSSDADGHWHACAACGDRLDYAGHTRTVENEKKATCTEEGYTGDTVCSVCGYVIEKGETEPATGHSFTSYVSNRDATCTEDGTETAACDNGCGATDARADEGSALGHELERIDAFPATCTEPGTRERWECARCGALFSDEDGTEPSKADELVVPATGHSPAAAWSSDEGGHWHACENGCGTRLDAASHDPETTGEKGATCTEEGHTGNEVCSICSYVIARGKTVPALGHDFENGV